MSYPFEDFAEFCSMKRDDYIEKLKEEAKKVPLSSIVELLDLDEIGQGVAREENHQFEKGTPISFSIHPRNLSFDISVWPDKTTLSRDHYEIIEYTGESAAKLYTALAERIVAEIENYEPPF